MSWPRNPLAGWFGGFVKQFVGPDSDSDGDGARHIAWFLETFAVVLLITAVAGLIIAVGSISTSAGQRVETFLAGVNFVGLGLLISCAAFAAGGVLGFLFGIPRVSAASADGVANPINSNTNLEQVSDWVTKIVVGLGLTQAHLVNGLLIDFSFTVQQALPRVKDAGLAACLILLGSCVAGFIAAYLKARTALVLAFAAAAHTVQEALSNLALNHMLDEATKVLNGRGEAADQNARNVATLLLRSAPDKTSSPTLLMQIGMAYAVNTNFPAAAAALAQAAKNDPGNDTVKFLAVRAAALARRNDTAASLADNTPPKPGPLDDKQIETSLAAMFAGLYTRGACASVIAIGERLAQDPKAQTKSRLWLYLAAAYGQAYALAKAKARPPGTVTADMHALKEKALNAATRAKLLDPAKNLPVLQQLWDPNAPGKPFGENDLESFIDDPDFIALLGPAVAAPTPPPSDPPPAPDPTPASDPPTPDPSPPDPPTPDPTPPTPEP